MRTALVTHNGSLNSCISIALLCGTREVHRRYSPDRTFSQEIQDRQNAFQWSAHHIFRPHQHFTYDPTSWSRVLAEKTKQQRTLSLVERVKLAREHAAERAGNVVLVQSGGDGNCEASGDPTATDKKRIRHEATDHEEVDSLPPYFFSAGDTQTSLSTSTAAPSADPWSDVSLQSLVDEVQRLHRLLHHPRYRGNVSLQRRAYQQEDYRTTVLQLYGRLRDAQLGESVTADACAFGWSVLGDNIEALLETLVSRIQDSPSLPRGDAIHEEAQQVHILREVFTAFRTQVLLPMDKNGRFFDLAVAGELSVEALIELLSVATLPFVRKCSAFFAESVTSDAALTRYIELTADAATQRARDSTSEQPFAAHPAQHEWLDPPHLLAWANSLRRLEARGVPVHRSFSSIVLHIEHAAIYVAQLLETVTQVGIGGHMKASLTGASPLFRQDATAQHERPMSPKPVRLDMTATPHGVQAPPTESGDVEHLLGAASATLSFARTAFNQKEQQEVGLLCRLVAVCLRMTTHCPNYDIDTDTAVAWACEVLGTGLLSQLGDAPSQTHHLHLSSPASEGDVVLSLRFLHLLSRLSYGSAVCRPAVGQLAISLCLLPVPAHAGAQERSEWRRLRGVTMRGALEVLQVADLNAGEARVTSVGPSKSWLEFFAFGEYDGLLPMALWREASLSLLPNLKPCDDGSARSSTFSPSSSSLCTREQAYALCVLCARFVERQQAGMSVSPNLFSMFTAQCVAECLGILQGDPTLPGTLRGSASAWDDVGLSLPTGLQPLRKTMQEVVRQASPHRKVLSF